jgi:hypothetical protein
VKRGRSLSFLVGTISNVLVMEIGWRDVGSGGYILVSCAHSNTSYIMYRVHLTMSGIWTHIFCGDRYWLHSCKSNYHTIMTMRAPSCIGVHICCNRRKFGSWTCYSQQCNYLCNNMNYMSAWYLCLCASFKFCHWTSFKFMDINYHGFRKNCI